MTRTTVRISPHENSEIRVRAGQKLKVPCNFDHDPLNRVTNIQWSKDGQPLTVGPKDRVDFGMDGSITVDDVQRRHEGEYR